MSKNTKSKITELSIWLAIPVSILTIMGSLHALLKETLLGVLKNRSLETISLSLLILVSCLVVAVTCILYLYKKLKENEPQSESLDIAPVLKEAEERMKKIGTQEYKSNTDLTNQLDDQIMFNILKIKGSNQRATPNVIAKEIDSTPEIVLAHLNEMHEKLLTSFITKESPPSFDTDFFLTEKAYMHIDIKKSNKEYLEHIKESNEAMPDRESSQFDDIP